MTSHNFEDASEEFLELKLDLERLLRDKLPYAQRESRKLLMNDISRKFEIAQSSLNEMQREIEKAYVSARPQLSYKLRTYQTELSALKRQVDQEVRRYQREQSSNPFDKPDVTSTMYFPEDDINKPSIWNKAGLQANMPNANTSSSILNPGRNSFSFMSGLDPPQFPGQLQSETNPSSESFFPFVAAERNHDKVATSPPQMIPRASQLASAEGNTVVKDPGYYSESECSSNSSERIDSERKGLKTSPIAAPISLPKLMDEEEPMNKMDDTWRAIKPPMLQGEASIVPTKVSSPFCGSPIGWSQIGSVKPSISLYKKPEICVFCKNNGEHESVYKTHTLMSTEGKVVCPILFAYRCPLCQATGDYAHTLKYCPLSQQLVVPNKLKGMQSNRPFGNLGNVGNMGNQSDRSFVIGNRNLDIGKLEMLKNNLGPPPPPLNFAQPNPLDSMNSIQDLQVIARKIVEFTSIMQNNNISHPPDVVNQMLNQFLASQTSKNLSNMPLKRMPANVNYPDPEAQIKILQDILQQISDSEKPGIRAKFNRVRDRDTRDASFFLPKAPEDNETNLNVNANEFNPSFAASCASKTPTGGIEPPSARTEIMKMLGVVTGPSFDAPTLPEVGVKDADVELEEILAGFKTGIKLSDKS